MVNSAPFRTSRQCQDLLRYIVLNSMEGKDESLRERIIGVQVFGRLPDYDQSEDQSSAFARPMYESGLLFTMGQMT